VVGFAVTDRLEIIFDSVDTSRKIRNLLINQLISFVIGGLAPGDERTVQYEGIADEPTGSELERMKAIYFSVFPNGTERLAWPGIVYTRVRATWIRYSDFNKSPPEILEFAANETSRSP
jgi:hypothetical protein